MDVRNSLLDKLAKRWLWARSQATLDAMTSLEQFHSFMDRVQDPIFREYADWNDINRLDFSSVVDVLQISLGGKDFLDIGPGCGASLDIARERGARRVDFIDHSPFVCTFNRLKGHTAIQLDVRKELGGQLARRYDVIWLKGTLSADRLIRRETSTFGFMSRYPRPGELLDQLDRLLAPEGWFVFCPHWGIHEGRRFYADVESTLLTRVFISKGYQVLPYTRGHNSEPVYPITYYKRVGVE